MRKRGTVLLEPACGSSATLTGCGVVHPTCTPLSVLLLISTVIDSSSCFFLQLLPPPTAHTKVGLREAQGTANKLWKQEVTRPGLYSVVA